MRSVTLRWNACPARLCAALRSGSFATTDNEEVTCNEAKVEASLAYVVDFAHPDGHHVRPVRALFTATCAEVPQLFARSVIATLRPCRWNRSVRFSLPPLTAPPFGTLHEALQRLHVFWRNMAKALLITMRDKFREGALPRFLLPVSSDPNFRGFNPSSRAIWI